MMSYEVRMILFLVIFMVTNLFLFDVLMDYLLANHHGDMLRIMMGLLLDAQ